jgi:hypothetical protein
MKTLMLSPVFSNYQLFESGIITSYYARASYSQDGVIPVIFDLINNTPYVLYERYGLYNPSRNIVRGTGQLLNQQSTLLIIAFTAVLIDLLTQSDVLFVNANGPVPNSGFASIIGVATSLNKPILRWKDDARTLWGFADNPMSIGLLPGVSQNLTGNPLFRLNTIDPNVKDGNCGYETLPILLKNILDRQVGPTVFTQNGTYLNNMRVLGRALNDSVTKNGIPYWFTEGQGGKIRDVDAVYKQINNIVQSKKYLLSKQDQLSLYGNESFTHNVGYGPMQVADDYSTITREAANELDKLKSVVD